MRTARLAAVLVLPALALAQDGAPAATAGSTLWDALPPGADLVIHTPSVPKFLSSAPETGLGSAEAWRSAFRAQIAKWGEATGAADRLQRGADLLLGFADGEAVLAAMEIPRRGLSGAPPQRAVLLAFRTRAKAKELTAAVDDVVAGGLRARWTAEPKVEQSLGRPVLSLQGPYDGLWISVEDGIFAAADHPLAIGLLHRGLERLTREKRAAEDITGMRLRVRWGRAGSPARWEGTTFLEREAVSSPLTGAFPVVSSPDEESVLSWVTNEPADLPLFPVPLPDEIVESSRTMNARPLVVRFLPPDGTWDVRGAGAPRDGVPPVVGSAARLGWLRAMQSGALDTVIPMDRTLLAGPIAAAERAKDEPIVHPWRPTEEAGEIRGPAWHGPVTFLALRALQMMATGKAPPAPVAATAAGPAPGSPSISGGSGQAPPLPEAPLPPPPPPPPPPGGTKDK